MADDSSHRRRVLLFLAASVFAVVALSPITSAQEKTAPALRWGGDLAGGAPYIFGPPGKEIGFEVELADYFGQKLGRTPKFVNGDWDALPDTLGRGDLDIVMNGYEYLSSREKEFPSTIPYYVYTLRLIVRRDDKKIGGWDDLAASSGQRKVRVGALRGSVAERYLRDRFGDQIELLPSREVVEAFDMVEGGERLDATVQDSPAAAWFIESGKRPKLHVVGEAVAPNYYVILTRPQDKELRERLNEAIREGVTSGRFKQIYSKYGLWNKEQEKLPEILERPWPPTGDDAPPETKLTLGLLWRKILQAAWMTVALSLCAMPLAIVLGLLVAVGRMYGPWPIRALLTVYVEVLRGTPLLLQIFVLFFLLPQLARATDWGPLIALATLPPFVVGVIGLGVNYSAAEAENYRAGLQAIPEGQMEAALSLGMTRWSALRRVILPQAIRLVIPPVTNDFIALFKDTSICSTILITELTGLYFQYKHDREITLQLAGIIALLYLLMSYPLSLLARYLEARQEEEEDEAA
jgi:polar amino acid transport system substrate-binding protein